MPNVKFLAWCHDCEHIWIPPGRRGAVKCSKCGSRNVMRAPPEDVGEVIKQKAFESGKRAARRWPERQPSPRKRTVDATRKSPSRSPRKPKDVPEDVPLHKSIGISEKKLEKILEEWRRFPQRAELDAEGRPAVREERNVKWISDKTGDFFSAHRLYHELLMPDAECEFEERYERGGR